MTYGSWDKKWVLAASCSPAVLEWIFLLPSSIWCHFSNNSLGKQQSNTGSWSLEKENCHWDLFLSPDPSTAWSWWEVRDCQPTAFKSSESCGKKMPGEAREGWKGWKERGQESLGYRKGVKADVRVLQFLGADTSIPEFYRLTWKLGEGSRWLLLGTLLYCEPSSTGASWCREQRSKVLSHSIPLWFHSWSHTGERGYWLKGCCPASTVRHNFAYLGYLWR